MLGGNVSKFPNLIQSCIVQVPMNGKVDGGYVEVLPNTSDDWTLSEMFVEFDDTTPILYKCAMTLTLTDERQYEDYEYEDMSTVYSVGNCTQYITDVPSEDNPQCSSDGDCSLGNICTDQNCIEGICDH